MLSPTRKRALARLYGLTEEDYACILEAQQGRCAICDRSFSASRPPHVEHDHRSGVIRGLACHHCNYTVLSVLHEDPDLYARVAAYLRFPPAVTAIGEHRVPGAPPPPAGKQTRAALHPERTEP
jgi:recombination endonuclease VII